MPEEHTGLCPTAEQTKHTSYLVVDPEAHELGEEGLGEACLDQLPVGAAQRRLKQTLAYNLARKLVQLQLQVWWPLGVRVNLRIQWSFP